MTSATENILLVSLWQSVKHSLVKKLEITGKSNIKNKAKVGKQYHSDIAKKK